MKPEVEFCSAKVACKELQWGALGWIALVKCSNAVQANCASADTRAMQNTQTAYVFLKKISLLQSFAARLKQTNSYLNMQTCITIAKSALDTNLNLAMLHYPKCKVMHIDTPNSIANIKH